MAAAKKKKKRTQRTGRPGRPPVLREDLVRVQGYFTTSESTFLTKIVEDLMTTHTPGPGVICPKITSVLRALVNALKRSGTRLCEAQDLANFEFNLANYLRLGAGKAPLITAPKVPSRKPSAGAKSRKISGERRAPRTIHAAKVKAKIQKEREEKKRKKAERSGATPASASSPKRGKGSSTSGSTPNGKRLEKLQKERGVPSRPSPDVDESEEVDDRAPHSKRNSGTTFSKRPKDPRPDFRQKWRVANELMMLLRDSMDYEDVLDVLKQSECPRELVEQVRDRSSPPRYNASLHKQLKVLVRKLEDLQVKFSEAE